MKKETTVEESVIPSWKNIGIACGILLGSTLMGYLFHSLHFTGANTITVYILGALLTSLFTKNYICSIGFSVTSVLLFNYLFTEPRLSLIAYESGYPVTFLIMLVASLITGTLAIKNVRMAKEKEQMELMAKNEQLRANLLRSISHDLRTPLTAISGNTENLLFNYEQIDQETREGLLKDVYEDSQWLIGLVENLLSITRISEGRMTMNMSVHLVDEVIQEALKHVKKMLNNHRIHVDCGEELLLANMDARLISQVIVNLVDNAVKYTPAGSEIHISARRKGDIITICVADNGPGIPDEKKSEVFKMFYTGENKVADCRRSMGLGLALCESIIHAHDGQMTLTDNQPSGCIFTFTMKAREVTLNE